MVTDPDNARSHDERNLAAIRQSLTKFGQVEPLVVRRGSNIVIGGNGRLEAMRSLEWKAADVTYFEGTDAEARALGLALNRTAELAAWDDGRLAAALAEVKEAGLLDAVGWTDADLAAVMEGVRGEVVEDEVPDPPADPVTKAGDLWAMGSHRLLCGDSTKAEDVRRLMAGAKASCVFTDPPYGVSISAKNEMLNTFQKAGRCLASIADDDLSPADLSDKLQPAFESLRINIMADDCSIFVCSPQGGGLSMMMMMMMQKAGLRTRHVIIWKKNQPTFSMGRLDYDYAHEPILFTWLKRHKRPMMGNHKTSVWEVDKPRKSEDHPTMKPVELYANAYLNNSDPGDNVADIYSGSGTAFIAAEQLGRRCYGMEISPAYCDVIVKRWETLTGKKAVLDGR